MVSKKARDAHPEMRRQVLAFTRHLHAERGGRSFARRLDKACSMTAGAEGGSDTVGSLCCDGGLVGGVQDAAML